MKNLATKRAASFFLRRVAWTALLLWAGLSNRALAQVPTWAWARNITAPGTLPYLKFTAVDAQGNTYVVGQFNQTLTLGSFTLTTSSPYTYQVYLAKLNASGIWQWAVATGGASGQTPTGIALDAAGNPVVSLYFKGTLVLGSTSLPANSAQFGSFAVGKASAATGSWLWGNKFGVDNNYYEPNMALAVAPTGDVLVSGPMPLLGQTFGTISLAPNGSFVARLNGSTGAWVSALRISSTGANGSSSETAIRAARCDAAGNAYITGRFRGTLTCGALTVTVTGAGSGSQADAFVAKISPTGQFLWVVRGGGIYEDVSNSLAVDAAGNAVITGTYYDTASFGSTVLGLGPGAGPSYKMFVAKLDPAGQWLWATGTTTNTRMDKSAVVALDATGQVYVAGSGYIAPGVLAFGPNAPTGSGNNYAASLTATGAWQWSTLFGNSLSDYVSLDTDGAGNAYLAGYYRDTFTIGPFALAAGGQFETASYVAKLGNLPLATRPGRNALGGLALWPQPAVAGQAVSLTAPAAGTFTLHNALGQCVFQVNVPATARQLNLPAALAPGIYQAGLRTADGQATGKLLVQ